MENDDFYDKFGQCHRLDGPAIEWANGEKSYYTNGKNYSYEDWCEIFKNSRLIYLL